MAGERFGRVLVTGTTGFLGSAIATHLRARGTDVVEVPGRKSFGQLASAFGDPVDVVIHAGFAVDFRVAQPELGQNSSVSNTGQLARAAADHGVRHFVFLNAAGILGVSSESRARNESDYDTTEPEFLDYHHTAYIQDKLACGPILAELEMPVADLLLTTVYGRHMASSVRDQLLGAARDPNPIIPCPPGGTSFVDLRDVLQGVDSVLEERIAGRFVISGGNTSYERLYRTLTDVAGTTWRKRCVRLPRQTVNLLDQLPLPMKSLGPGVLRSAFGFKYYSAEWARHCFGYRPRRSLADALAATINA